MKEMAEMYREELERVKDRILACEITINTLGYILNQPELIIELGKLMQIRDMEALIYYIIETMDMLEEKLTELEKRKKELEEEVRG